MDEDDRGRRPRPDARAASGSGRPSRPGRPRAGGGSRPGRPRAAGGAGSGRSRSDTSPSRSPRREEPALPDEVTASQLDSQVRAELSALAAPNAEAVARHLVMAGRLIDEDPEAAFAHANAARQRAGRIGAVREAAGLTAYAAGKYAEALAELRSARRITGDQSLLPVMADCERGLGRPEKALELAAGPEVERLDAAGRVELLIVMSGARRDMGQPAAAALLLQGPELRPERRKPWSARLFYAYADALLECSRRDEARTWFQHAAEADAAGETDAEERFAELD